MSKIHRTTLTPSKLDLLTGWLPDQPWYVDRGHEPLLTKAGGFRLDDPDGEVGIEFVFVNDEAGGVTYQVPLTYRGEPLPSARSALVGTGVHGVLGTRWVYDAPHDPVFAGQLLALLGGVTQPQHQSKTDTADASVAVHASHPDVLELVAFDARDDADATTLRITGGDADEAGRVMTVRVPRILTAGEGPERLARVVAPWRGPDGVEGRGVVIEFRNAAG